MRAVKNKNTFDTIELKVWQRNSSLNYIYDFSAYIEAPSLKPDFCQGAGIDINKKIAKNKAIFEAVERYSSSLVPTNLQSFSVESLKGKINFLRPNDIILFSNSQYKYNFKYKPYLENEKIEWVKGYSHIDKQEVLVPAFSVYLGYNLHRRNVFLYNLSCSCGLAAEKSYEKAVVKGTLELIERDVCMKVWLTKKIIPRVILSSFNNLKLKKLISKLQNDGLNIEICITTSEFNIPSVIAIIYSQQKKIPYASFGLAAGDDIEKVSLKAVCEAIMIRNSLERLNKMRKIKKITDYTLIKDFEDHIIFYADPDNKDKWNFLTEGKQYTLKEIKKMFNYPNVNNFTLENINKTLITKGKNLISVNLTSDISHELNLYVTRILIPGLFHLDYDYNYRFLGFPDKNSSVLNLNQDPHPFG